MEPFQGHVPGVEIKLINQQHLRSGALDDFGYGVRLVATRCSQFCSKNPAEITVERRVERGEAHRSRFSFGAVGQRGRHNKRYNQQRQPDLRLVGRHELKTRSI